MALPISETIEWLETDGLGGYAMGTTSTLRTRRYHGLLCAAASPPTDRRLLVNGVEAEIVVAGQALALSSQRYEPGVVHPDGATRLRAFTAEPWPTWSYALPGGLSLRFELCMTRGAPQTVLRWELEAVGARTTEELSQNRPSLPVAPAAGAPFRSISRPSASAAGDFATAPAIQLEVRPLLSDRNHHALHRENAAFRFSAEASGAGLLFHPYPGAPPIGWLSNGRFTAQPLWYRHFLYTAERARGLDAIEDLAAPGVLTFDLSAGPAVLVLSAMPAPPDAGEPGAYADALFAGERERRAALGSPAARAASAYIARRGAGKTIIAGYPWFTDWGRDTFIALRGLRRTLAGLDPTLPLDVLRAWAGAVSEGMIPNRFPDEGEAPEFNSVDGGLWFVVAAGEVLEASGATLASADQELLRSAVLAILRGYDAGTRHGIRAEPSGLLAAGEPGCQLTWMDAKCDDQVITPRVGKPVEVQALWINALTVGGRFDASLRTRADLAQSSFLERFWHPGGFLRDVVDCDHVPGRDDDSFRPNQVFAVGGLPLSLLDGPRARAMLSAVERELVTPLGLRTLSPKDPRYQGRYSGGVRARDGAYHQGTVWPWLMGPFVEAWIRVHGSDRGREARAKFLGALETYARGPGMGHLPEIADGDPPHTPRGCPFQAWSLAELLRLTS